MNIEQIPAIVINVNYADIITQGTAVSIEFVDGSRIDAVFAGIDGNEIAFDDGNCENRFEYKLEEILNIYSL